MDTNFDLFIGDKPVKTPIAVACMAGITDGAYIRNLADHIGLGIIGSTGLSLLLNDKRFEHIDYIMETPVDDVRNDKDNLEIVKALIRD